MNKSSGDGQKLESDSVRAAARVQKEGMSQSLGWEVAEQWEVPSAFGKHEETFLCEGDSDGNSSGRRV